MIHVFYFSVVTQRGRLAQTEQNGLLSPTLLTSLHEHAYFVVMGSLVHVYRYSLLHF